MSGHAERVAALSMIEAHADRPRSVTLGADRGYDAADFVNELRSMNVRPHVVRLKFKNSTVSDNLDGHLLHTRAGRQIPPLPRTLSDRVDNL